MVNPPETLDKPRQRCVVLGASNVARGLGTLVAECRARCTAVRADGEPRGPEILVATGRGRSWGHPAGILGRQNPGLVASPLWELLEPGPPTFALLTDVGNDVLYGSSPAVIAGWVGTCLSRLRAIGARSVLAGMPRTGLARLTRARFDFWKHVFFPARHLAFDAALAAIDDLDRRLREIAAAHGAAFVEPDPAWYGFDPIHVRRGQSADAWRTYLAGWGPPESDALRPRGSALASSALGLRLNLARSAAGTWFRRPCRAPQPSWRAADGTSVGLY